jgi:tetratricopeptide (TPR) repeat protein
MATPLDITYSTPYNVGPSPQVAASPSLEVGHPTPQRQPAPWTPAPNPSTPRLQLAQVTWNGHTMTDLEKMAEEADDLAHLGRPDDAEKKFRDALAGLKALLSPTHERTNALAYRLAEFYAQNERMNDADTVLNWMGEKHVERWGIEHERTISHLMFVADMFHRWARPEHAMTLIDRAVEVYQRVVGREQASELLGVSDTHRNRVSMTALDRSTAGAHEASSPKSAEERQARYQLGLAKAHAKAENEVAESMLKELINQCNNHPEALLVQAFEARSALIGYYNKVGRKDKLGAILVEACTLFWATFDSPCERPLSLLQSTCNIAFAHVEAGLDETAEDLLAEIVSTTEDTFGPDDGYTVSILISIGTFYQRKRRWNDARPYYEHALALSMTATGPNSAQSRKLETALENEHYVAILPGCDDIKSTLRQRHTLLFGRQS